MYLLKLTSKFLLLALLSFNSMLLQAHVLTVGIGLINITQDQILSYISFPVSILKGVDDNSDGLLQPQEIKNHKSEIFEQLNESLIFTVAGEHPVTITDDLLVSVHLDSKGSTDQIAWSKRSSLPAGALFNQPIQIQMNWFDSTNPKTNSKNYAFQVRRQEEFQVAVFSKHLPNHTFFDGPLQVFLDWSELGLDHIFLGINHLIVILLLLISTSNARKWPLLLSLLLVTQACAYTIGALGYIFVDSYFAEVATLMIICALGALNWFKKEVSVVILLGVVSLLGVSNGLGFAWEMMQYAKGIDLSWINVSGMISGISLGQMLFSAALGVTVWMVQKTSLSRFINPHTTIKTLAISCVVVAAYFFFRPL
jgi:hypothetical protein